MFANYCKTLWSLLNAMIGNGKLTGSNFRSTVQTNRKDVVHLYVHRTDCDRNSLFVSLLSLCLFRCPGMPAKFPS